MLIGIKVMVQGQVDPNVVKVSDHCVWMLLNILDDISLPFVLFGLGIRPISFKLITT